MIYLELFYTFFIIGLFGFGGDNSMLSLIQTETVQNHNAGMNGMMAVLGSVTATIAIILPSFIIMLLIFRMFFKYMNTSITQSIIAGLRPVVVGLLAAATLLLCNVDNFSQPSINPWQFCSSSWQLSLELCG